MSWVVGVDVGGTFTDFCLFNRATNEVVVHKVPSTPEDPSRAMATSGAPEAAIVNEATKILSIAPSRRSLASTGPIYTQKHLYRDA